MYTGYQCFISCEGNSISQFVNFFKTCVRVFWLNRINFYIIVCINLSSFFIAVLLRYNSCAVWFTHLKCTIQCFLMHSQGVLPSMQSGLEHFVTPERNPTPTGCYSPSCPHSPSPKQQLICFLSLYICLLWTFHIMESYSMWFFFVTGFFPLVCFQDYFVICTSTLFFLFPNIPLYGYTNIWIFYLSINWWTLRLFLLFWLLWVMLLWAFARKFLCGCVLSLL